MNALAIPADDSAEFAALPDEVRREIREWQLALAPAFTAKRKGQAIAAAAKRMGKSVATARRKYDMALVIGWRAFINHSKVPAESEKLPAEFVEFWKSICGRNQRKHRPAYRELVRRFRAGESFPGYSDDELPRERKVADLPRGWSERNLYRHVPTKFEATAARIGRSAAANFRPLVFTTRAELYVGAFYLFDDMWHDHVVHVPGQRAPRRPLEFHALDLFSACKFAWGIKPALEREDGTQERLKEAEMRFLLAQVLARDGYSQRGTTLVVEHGTAAIREDLEALLSDLSGGLIKVARSGIEGAAAFAGQYAGRAKGNFRFKAALESLGNLIHNEMAFLPGQTGSNSRLNQPEELAGRIKHHDALVRAMAALPPERAELLRLPVLDIATFQAVATEIYRRINERTEHELEGWEEAGLLVPEIRLSTSLPWMSARETLALPDAQRAAIEALAAVPGHSRVRRMSPAEVWGAQRRDLVPLAPHAIALILGRDLGAERRVRRGLFEFEEKESGPGIFRYLAQLENGDMLREGETYLTILNPHAPEVLHVLDSRGCYVGACRRWDSISRGDTEALHKQCGRAAKIESALLAPVATRGAELTRRRMEDARHNAEVLRGSPITPIEKSRAREDRDRGAQMSDFLPTETAEDHSDAVDAGSFLNGTAPTAGTGESCSQDEDPASAADFL